MQSELKPLEHKTVFVSGGPKNYAYRLISNEDAKTACNVRGITLNYHSSKVVNFEVIRVTIL